MVIVGEPTFQSMDLPDNMVVGGWIQLFKVVASRNFKKAARSANQINDGRNLHLIEQPTLSFTSGCLWKTAT